MRHFLLIFILASLFSCNRQDEPEVTGGADGELLNLQDSTVHLYSYVSPIEQIKGVNPEFSEEISVDSNGIFIYPHMFSEGYYYFEYDHNTLKYFIAEGKKLSIDLDATKPTSKPDYSGKMKYESRYLFDKHALIANYQANKEAYYSLSESQFLDVVNQLRGKLDTMLVMYITNRPIGSKYFMEQESLGNYYLVANEMVEYSLSNPELVSDSFNLLIDQVKLVDERSMTNENYFAFLTSSTWRNSNFPSNKENAFSAINYIDTNLFGMEIQDFLRYQMVEEVVNWERDEDQKVVLDSLISLQQNDSIRRFTVSTIQLDTITPILIDTIISE